MSTGGDSAAVTDAAPRTVSAASVPFIDLSPANEVVRVDVLKALSALAERGTFVNGPPVEQFEALFAAACGRDHCVALASGLDALRLGLIGAGIGAGMRVLVPAMTFVATFEAVVQAGATPVPVDVRAIDAGLDPEAAAAALDGVDAILPVHLYGQMADMKAIRALADSRGLVVIEDACQAHGAARDGVRPGAASTAAAFSFYPSKNLGGWGDGGALVTDDHDLVSRAKALREHGQTAKYHSEYVGYTARLDAVQAVVLSHKLRHLEAWNEQRRALARRYDEALEGVGDLVLPRTVAHAEHVWHLYTVRTARPASLADHLLGQGIATGRHYPQPPHLAPAFAHLGRREGEFPVAEAIGRETLSLPIFPGMTDAQVETVARAVRSSFDD
jgi:dTDP-4-amino-4,6-dideoxygalactose transaminase